MQNRMNDVVSIQTTILKSVSIILG